jgi:hypothetical protein
MRFAERGDSVQPWRASSSHWYGSSINRIAAADGLQDNLTEFHSKHFGGAPPNKPTEESWEEEDDDDGLGYYDDGTKRTLTDEQIAMFRHSEIQDLIKRCARAKLEREEAAEDDDVEMLNSADAVAEEAGSAAGNVGANSESRTAAAKGGQESPPSGKPKNGKRKRGPKPARRDPDDFKDEGKSKTYRRICRDMDTSKDEIIVLDY